MLKVITILLLIPSFAMAQLSTGSGLVAYWPLDQRDQSGLITFDRSGNENHGILLNSPVKTIGKIGEGYTLNSTNNSKTTIANFRSADQSGSISLWFKTTSTGTVQAMFSSADEASTNNYISVLMSPVGLVGRIYLQNNTGVGVTNQVYSTSGVYNDGNWHHAVIISNSSTWSIYVDGVLQSLTVTLGLNTGDWFADSINRDNVTIGNLNRSTPIAYFQGSLDDVRVYNRVLSQGEVKELYRMGLTKSRLNSFLASMFGF